MIIRLLVWLIRKHPEVARVDVILWREVYLSAQDVRDVEWVQ